MKPSASRRQLQLQRHASVEAGLQAILSHCLANIESKQAHVLRDNDTENLHQMRVGVRRLRCALKLFKSVAPCPTGLANDIAWLGGVLGDARDWDVLSTATLAPLADLPEDPVPLSTLRALLRDPVQQGHARVAQALLSARHAGLLQSLRAWLEGDQWRGSAGRTGAKPRDVPLRQFADDTLALAHKRLLKRGRRLSAGDPAALHRLRAEVKHCHYAARFFSSLYRPKCIDKYIETLALMQDELGRRNDLAVADRLLRQLAKEQPGDIAAAAFARGFLRGRLADGSGKLRKRWRALLALKLPQH